MPTVLSFNGVKIKVYAKDHNPPHAHVIGNGGNARYNLKTLKWIESIGFTKGDLNLIEAQISYHYKELLDAWSEYNEK